MICHVLIVYHLCQHDNTLLPPHIWAFLTIPAFQGVTLGAQFRDVAVTVTGRTVESGGQRANCNQHDLPFCLQQIGPSSFGSKCTAAPHRLPLG